MPDTKYDAIAFGNAVHRKRGDRSVREAADVTGVSASTLSRIENGGTPDIETYLTLVDWLGPDAPAPLPATHRTPAIDRAMRMLTGAKRAEIAARQARSYALSLGREAQVMLARACADADPDDKARLFDRLTREAYSEAYANNTDTDD